MSLEFRKSLFGFNQDDVVNYIKKTHKNFKLKIEVLNSKLEDSKKDYQKLLTEKNEISRKLAAYIQKAEEIEMLSEKIGKLYLVSQTTAQAIIAEAEEKRRLIEAQAEKNLSAVEDANSSLNELRATIMKTSDGFINEIDALLSSLNTTRDQFAVNIKETAANSTDTETVTENTEDNSIEAVLKKIEAENNISTL